MKLYSVANGKKKKLEEVKDEAFAQKMMGDGIAIVPEDGMVVAPADGVVSALFPTNHAIGLTLDAGAEILIHIGIDTVEMNGEGFTAYVKQGDRVKRGDKLIAFDVEKVLAAGYETDIMVIVTNTASYASIQPSAATQLTTSDVLLEIE